MSEIEKQTDSKLIEPTTAKVVPLFGRDEMNLVEFPFGPITPSSGNTLEIDHVVRDRNSKREVSRRLIITGSDAFGLPRPIDEQVLVGLKALTQESGFNSRKVWFSQYHLCRTLGWSPDGRAYKRLEASLDRIAGTTLKFKNAWWDKGETAWRSHTFHLLDNVELCSAERYEQMRGRSGNREQAACHFVWNEVIWKSFEDGYIKLIDMDMFRRIANGRRREVPLRLYRWLDKQFWKQEIVKIDVAKLSIGTLGLAAKYPSEFQRIIERAARVLIDCKFLGDIRFQNGQTHSGIDVLFLKHKSKLIRARETNRVQTKLAPTSTIVSENYEPDSHAVWLEQQTEEQLQAAEDIAIQQTFGSKLERQIIDGEKRAGKSILESGRIRQEYIRRFLEPERYGAEANGLENQRLKVG
jgi:hypothetical protein